MNSRIGVLVRDPVGQGVETANEHKEQNLHLKNLPEKLENHDFIRQLPQREQSPSCSLTRRLELGFTIAQRQYGASKKSQYDGLSGRLDTIYSES